MTLHGGGGGGPVAHFKIVKALDQSVASGTVLQADTVLQFVVGAGEIWDLHFTLIVGNALKTTGAKVGYRAMGGTGWCLPDAVTYGDGVFVGDVSTAAASGTTHTTSDANWTTVNSDTGIIRGSCSLSSGSAQSSFYVMWAQATSSVTNLTVKAGSFLLGHRIA